MSIMTNDSNQSVTSLVIFDEKYLSLFPSDITVEKYHCFGQFYGSGCC
jgi:hypothetical protein